MKFLPHRAEPGGVRRSPCGERGLKWKPIGSRGRPASSLPVRGAWIEIVIFAGTWRLRKSLPVRGAWIEITRIPKARMERTTVAPRAGSVD